MKALQPSTSRTRLVLLCLALGVGCAGDGAEAPLRELLVEYVRLQGVHIAVDATYFSNPPVELTVPPDVDFQILGASGDGHAALAFLTAEPDFVCAVRVGGVTWGLAAIPSNGQPVCGGQEDVLSGGDSIVAEGTERADPTVPPAPPGYARYFPLIARAADLPLDDPAERAEIVLAITHALTQPAENLEPLTVLDQHLEPAADPLAVRYSGDSGAAGWRVEDLRTEARQLIRRLRDPALLPVAIHGLITAADGRRGEFRNLQSLLVSASGIDSAPYVVESTPSTRRGNLVAQLVDPRAASRVRVRAAGTPRDGALASHDVDQGLGGRPAVVGGADAVSFDHVPRQRNQ